LWLNLTNTATCISRIRTPSIPSFSLPHLSASDTYLQVHPPKDEYIFMT
jgi:hypothetical protein